jgi:hypothetical protein
MSENPLLIVSRLEQMNKLGKCLFQATYKAPTPMDEVCKCLVIHNFLYFLVDIFLFPQ